MHIPSQRQYNAKGPFKTVFVSCIMKVSLSFFLVRYYYVRALFY